MHANILQINFKLHSLTLLLSGFRYIFVVIQYTPNLKYLNVKSLIPRSNESAIDKVNVKLKELHLTLNKPNDYVNISLLIDGIKQFSSSLVCLSLDLVDYSVRGINQFLFNSLQLPQLLESMKELKQFHLYTKQPSYQYKDVVDFSQFKDQYWFKQNPSFGMYGDYIYTLPFHFNNIYDCFQDFNEIKLNNCEILEKDSRIWYNVKSIQMPDKCCYNRNFVKELKRKMPKLTLIRFDSYWVSPKMETDDLSENKDVTLDNVTTIGFTRGNLEKHKDWIIYSLPNLRHLILSHRTAMPSIDSELAPILNKTIRRLDIDATCEKVEQLPEISYACFSNVENINFYMDDGEKSSEWYANIIIKILKNFKKLKILMVRIAHLCNVSFLEHNVPKIIEYLKMNEMDKNYQVEYLNEYTLFSKISYEI
jgi:hypothetical protein